MHISWARKRGQIHIQMVRTLEKISPYLKRATTFPRTGKGKVKMNGFRLSKRLLLPKKWEAKGPFRRGPFPKIGNCYIYTRYSHEKEELQKAYDRAKSQKDRRENNQSFRPEQIGPNTGTIWTNQKHRHSYDGAKR